MRDHPATKRPQRSEVHADIGWRQLVEREDRTWSQLLRPQARVPIRKPLLAFCHDQKAKGWAGVVRDPEAAAALRYLRHRVAQLQQPDRAALPSDWAHSVMNGRDGRLPQPRQREFRTSVIHPLGNAEQLLTRAPMRPHGDPTSLWCPGWGAIASEAEVDLTFRLTSRFEPCKYRSAASTRLESSPPLGERCVDHPWMLIPQV
jgi:hypothetical protein